MCPHILRRGGSRCCVCIVLTTHFLQRQKEHGTAKHCQWRRSRMQSSCASIRSRGAKQINTDEAQQNQKQRQNTRLAPMALTSTFNSPGAYAHQKQNARRVLNLTQCAQDTRTCRATAKPTKVTAAATTAWSSQRPQQFELPSRTPPVLVRTPSKAASAIRLLIPTREASLLTPRKPTSARCVDPWRVASAHCEGDHVGAPPMPPPPLDCQLPPLNFASD